MNIKLRYSVKKAGTTTYSTAIDLHYLVLSSDSSLTNIFMMQVLPKNAQGLQDYLFSHVADPTDLEDYPPYYDSTKAFFRTNDITLRLRSLYQLKQVISVISQLAKDLVDIVNYLDKSDSLSFTDLFLS